MGQADVNWIRRSHVALDELTSRSRNSVQRKRGSDMAAWCYRPDLIKDPPLELSTRFTLAMNRMTAKALVSRCRLAARQRR
jgi:hypothetical protein